MDINRLKRTIGRRIERWICSDPAADLRGDETVNHIFSSYGRFQSRQHVSVDEATKGLAKQVLAVNCWGERRDDNVCKERAVRALRHSHKQVEIENGESG